MNAFPVPDEEHPFAFGRPARADDSYDVFFLLHVHDEDEATPDWIDRNEAVLVGGMRFVD